MAVNTPGAGGYQGLGSIFQILQGGINQSQMDNLSAGATGANGMGVGGGVHGAFGGLSPYAVHFLATSGLLNKVAAPTTGPDGQPLTGSALLMANLMHGLQGDQYKLADGITQDNLASLFGVGFDGHSAYAKGFDAQGGQPPIFQPPGMPHRQPPGHRGPQGGPVHAGGGHPPMMGGGGGGGQLPFRTLQGGAFTGRGTHGMGTGHHGIGPGRRIGRKAGGPVSAPVRV